MLGSSHGCLTQRPPAAVEQYCRASAGRPSATGSQHGASALQGGPTHSLHAVAVLRHAQQDRQLVLAQLNMQVEHFGLPLPSVPHVTGRVMPNEETVLGQQRATEVSLLQGSTSPPSRLRHVHSEPSQSAVKFHLRAGGRARTPGATRSARAAAVLCARQAACLRCWDDRLVRASQGRRSRSTRTCPQTGLAAAAAPGGARSRRAAARKPCRLAAAAGVSRFLGSR